MGSDSRAPKAACLANSPAMRWAAWSSSRRLRRFVRRIPMASGTWRTVCQGLSEAERLASCRLFTVGEGQRVGVSGRRRARLEGRRGTDNFLGAIARVRQLSVWNTLASSQGAASSG